MTDEEEGNIEDRDVTLPLHATCPKCETALPVKIPLGWLTGYRTMGKLLMAMQEKIDSIEGAVLALTIQRGIRPHRHKGVGKGTVIHEQVQSPSAGDDLGPERSEGA